MKKEKIIVFLASLGIRLYFGLHLYRLWSNIHRALFDRKWKDTPLPHFSSLSDVAERASRYVWKQDGLTELGDAVCSAQKVEAVGFNGESPHGNDCDDIANWLVNVVTMNVPFSDKNDKISQGIVGVYFLTVMWYTPGKGFSGHNVCLLAYEVGGINFVRYMDYGYPRKMRHSATEIADDIVALHAPGSIRLPWVVSDKNLKPLLFE